MLARKQGYLWLLIMVFAAIASVGQAMENIRITNDLTLGYNSISGDGKDQSSLSKGYRYLNILGINGNGKLSNGYEYQYLGGFKFTDDIRNDIKNISLTNLQARFSNNINAYTAGDVLEYYSQYTLNSALKGLSYRYTDANSKLQNVGLIYGMAYPRWDSVAGVEEVKTIRRHAMGGTIRHMFNTEWTAGFTAVGAFDQTGTRVVDTDPAYTNGVYAVDAEYNPFPGLIVNSELALSAATIKVKDTADDSRSGNAFKIGAVGTGGPSRVTAEIERVAPKFVTLLGAATPDREKFKTQWRYNYTKDITTAVGELTYKLFNQTTGDIKTNDHILNANYRDRFSEFDTDTNLGYTMYSTEENIRDSSEITFNTMIGTQYTMNDMTLRPNISLGVWNMNDDLVSKSNSIMEYALGSALEIPAKNLVAHARVGMNQLKNDISTEDSDKFFFSGDAYYRPEFLASMRGTMFVKVFLNSYSYTTTANDFRETGFLTGLSTQF
jgi:hypothetical protein